LRLFRAFLGVDIFIEGDGNMNLVCRNVRQIASWKNSSGSWFTFISPNEFERISNLLQHHFIQSSASISFSSSSSNVSSTGDDTTACTDVNFAATRAHGSKKGTDESSSTKQAGVFAITDDDGNVLAMADIKTGEKNSKFEVHYNSIINSHNSLAHRHVLLTQSSYLCSWLW
jgi:hypothetical protein